MNGQQDGNPIVKRFVDDNETIDCETAYILAKIGSSRAHHWLISVLASLCINASQFFESNLKTATGLIDAGTDVQQAFLCHWRLVNLGHPAQPSC